MLDPSDIRYLMSLVKSQVAASLRTISQELYLSHDRPLTTHRTAFILDRYAARIEPTAAEYAEVPKPTATRIDHQKLIAIVNEAVERDRELLEELKNLEQKERGT